MSTYHMKLIDYKNFLKTDKVDWSQDTLAIKDKSILL